MKIDRLILSSNSIAELKEFYQNTLGLEVTADDKKSLCIRAGSSELIFSDSTEIEKPYYHFAFNIPENQFKEAKNWLKKRVQLIDLNGEDEFDFKSWNAHSVYFYDTCGNILEFIARHNLKNQSHSEFKGSSILNISEAGFPVKNVGKFYEFLQKEFSIPMFSGDLKTFTAAGDEDGLFIIVNENRKWFPDCPEAGIFPIKVLIKGNEYKELRFGNLHYVIVSRSE